MVVYSPELCKHGVQGEGAGRLQMLPDPNVCCPFSPWVCTVWKEGQGKVSMLWSHSHRKHLLLNIWCGIKPIPERQTQPLPWFLPRRKFRKGFWEEGRRPVGCGWHSKLRVELLGSEELSMDPSGGQQGALSYPSCASCPGKPEREEMGMLEWEIQGWWGLSNPKCSSVPSGHSVWLLLRLWWPCPSPRGGNSFSMEVGR